MTEPPTQHIVVVGAQSTALRLVEELERAGERVVVVVGPDTDPDTVDDLVGFGAETVVARRIGESTLLRANVAQAKAAVLFGSDDVEQLQVALAIEEANPHCRIILELANPRLGRRLPALLGDVTVLSSAALAAPALVAAVLHGDEVTAVEIAGRPLVAGPATRVGGELLAGLASTDQRGATVLLPDTGADVVLGTRITGGPEPTPVKTSGLAGIVTHLLDSKARWVLVGIVVLVLVSALYFRATGLDWLTALLYALTASTATGGPGDFGDLSVGWRIGAVVIALFGLLLSSGITALIIDGLIGSRLAALTGGVRGKPRHHVVVVGLGRVGVAVVSELVSRRIPVVAIEEREDAIGVRRARRLKVPVVIAEGSDATALETAGLGRAAAVIAVTDDDGTNLEIGLAAKELQDSVRVVIRVFDHNLAERIERKAGLGLTRSVSMLAAPAFAAAAMGRRFEVVVPIGRRVLLFTELTVPAGSPAVGRSIGSVAGAESLRVLAIRRQADWSWQVSDGDLIAAGDQLAVVATRAGLARLLLAIKYGTAPGVNGQPASTPSTST